MRSPRCHHERTSRPSSTGGHLHESSAAVAGLVGALLGGSVLTDSAGAAEFKLQLPLGLQEQAANVPDDNPLAPEKIALGKQFFWDKRWSKNGTVACVSCHLPDHGWAESDKGAIKTPTLRDIAKHPPYMHDGSVKTLDDVVSLYNQGGHKNPWLSEAVKPLGLTADQQADLVAFLHSLTGEVSPEIASAPKLP